MAEVLQLDDAAETRPAHDAPKLLVEWSSRWDEFRTSIRPALARSTARLAGEAPYGLFPYRKMVGALILEAFLMFVVIVVPGKIAEMRPYVAPAPAGHDVIYYSGDELPRTEDLGGSQAGGSGRSGGQEAHHRTQTIRVARGGSLVEKVVDAPNLKLPASTDAVANLLAVNPIIGPPPSEGMRSSRRAPNMAANIVAPAPSVTGEYTRDGLTLTSIVPPAPTVSGDARGAAPTLSTTIVAPAPSVTRDRVLVAPRLNSSIIAPAPRVTDEHTLVAPRLDAAVVAPAPSVSGEHRAVAPRLDSSVIAPAPTVSGARERVTPGINTSVIAPAPADVRDPFSPSPVQMATSVVPPPPVSSPERVSARNSKLALPAPSVIAPPPSANSADMRRLSSGASQVASSVVPPPPSQPSGGSFMSSLIGKIFGPSVVPPPPSAPSQISSGAGRSLNANVVPPPPSVGTSSNTSNGRGSRAAGPELSQSVVPPPPTSAAGSSRRSYRAANPSVIAPPPAADTGASAGDRHQRIQLANNVVPPPPSVGGGTSLEGTGRGTNGAGFGGAMSSGSVLAPPAGGSGSGAGVVVSSQPGSKVGNPGSSSGSLAMSPAGGDRVGIGGNGGGKSIGHGNGPGSGMAGESTGAGNAGAGHGSDPSAHGGISPTTGSGGAGNGTTGVPPVPGVSINGGSTIVTLPSFGSDSGGGASGAPGRSSVKAQQGPAITIVATSRSGGAFNFYGKLPGDNYTVYLDSSIGTVVMQFADPVSASRSYPETLTGPQGLRTDLPAGIPRARMVVQCVLDASGNLKNFRVLEPGPAAMTAKVMATLPNWKFRPAMRGNQPIEVNAILGFGIDTNDRF